MDLLLSDPYAYMDSFFLIVIRMLGVMLLVPFLSNRNIPAMTKVALAVFTSLILVNVVPTDVAVTSADIIPFAILVTKEFITGWLIGLSVYAVLAALTLAGQFIDYQIGFSMVNVFDPLSQTNITVTGNFYYFLYLMIFLATRSYGFVFIALKKSFSLIPLGQMVLTTYLYDSFIDFFNAFFLIALQISAPVFFVMLVTNGVLGILARTVPQLNMFVIGFPIKIILGLVILYLLSYLFVNLTDIVTEEFLRMLDVFIRGMSP